MRPRPPRSTRTDTLCPSPTLFRSLRQTHDGCRQCFPERPVGFFQARRADLLRHLALADWVVAPSRFLAARLVEWGLTAAQLRGIANGVPKIGKRSGKERECTDVERSVVGLLLKKNKTTHKKKH